MKTTTIDYGKTIKRLRKEHRMTQSELAEKISMGKTSVSNYETGYSMPSAPLLEEISAIFGMTFSEFLEYGQDSRTSEFDMPRLAQGVNDKVIAYIKEANINRNVLEADTYMDSYLSVPGFMLNEDAKYICIKMPDDSMEGDHIRKNDYIIVRKSKKFENRSLVLAIYHPENIYVIRRYIRDGHIAALVPSSDSARYPIIRADERDGDISIIGYVEKAIVTPK